MPMSKPFVYIVTFVVCIFLQVAVAPAISIGGCSPDFLLIPVLLVSLHSGVALGSLAGFGLGLLEDFIGDGAVGCMALAFTLIALIVGLAAAGVDLTTPALQAVVGLVSPFLMELFYGLANIMTSSDASGAMTAMAAYSVPCALYTALFCVFALLTIRLVMVDEMPSDISHLSGGYGSGGSSSPSKYL